MSLDRFMQEAKQSLAPTTCQAYRYLLGPLDDQLREKGGLEKADLSDVNEYLESRKDHSKKTRTMALSTVKTFFKWQMSELSVPVTPEEMRAYHADRQRMEKIVFCRTPNWLKKLQPRKREKALTVQGLYEAMRTAQKNDDAVGFDIMYLLAYFGFRRSELMSIKKTDIKAENGAVCVQVTTAKTYVPRKLYLSAATYGILQRWLAEKEKLEAYHLNEFLENYSKKAGCHLYPHLLRHMFNTEMRRKTGKDHIVKKLMGHKMSDMTDYYTMQRDDDLKKAMLDDHYFNDPPMAGIGTTAWKAV